MQSASEAETFLCVCVCDAELEITLKLIHFQAKSGWTIAWPGAKRWTLQVIALSDWLYLTSLECLHQWLFVRSQQAAPRKNGVTCFGQRPARMTLTKSTMAAKSPCLIRHAERVFEMLGTHAVWSTRDLAGNDKTPGVYFVFFNRQNRVRVDV